MCVQDAVKKYQGKDDSKRKRRENSLRKLYIKENPFVPSKPTAPEEERIPWFEQLCVTHPLRWESGSAESEAIMKSEYCDLEKMKWFMDFMSYPKDPVYNTYSNLLKTAVANLTAQTWREENSVKEIFLAGFRPDLGK